MFTLQVASLTYGLHLLLNFKMQNTHEGKSIST